MEWQDQAEANAMLGVALGVGFLGFLGLLAIGVAASRGSSNPGSEAKSNPGDDIKGWDYCFHPGADCKPGQVYRYHFGPIQPDGRIGLIGLPQEKTGEDVPGDRLAYDVPEVVKKVARQHCQVSLKGQYMEAAALKE